MVALNGMLVWLELAILCRLNLILSFRFHPNMYYSFYIHTVQATCGIPEIAFSTFENMEFGEGVSIIACVLDLHNVGFTLVFLGEIN